MHNLNTTLFELIHGYAGHYMQLDWFFIGITSYWMQVLVFVSVGFYVFIYIPLMTPPTWDRLRSVARAGEIAIAILTVFFITKVIKVLVAFPRPFEVIQNIHTLVTIAGGDSFPSMHSALSMALATSVYPHHKRLGGLLFAFAFVVGISRIYVGVHYPFDVGVGFALGFLIPKLFHRAFAQKRLAKEGAKNGLK